MTARDWLSRFSAIGEICLVLVLGNLVGRALLSFVGLPIGEAPTSTECCSR